ncbi:MULTISPECIES: VirK family protein [unclassified Sinorhizobium]|uniref:VirK family protein n=1 Tax=unclassified Sinorhizobium TaxID=2613772 RepID=UPI003525F144
MMMAVLLFSTHDAIADEGSVSFGALQNAILDGKSIGMTLDLSKCVIHDSTEAGPPVKGSQKFDAFMIQADQTIAFSSMHFRLRSDRTPVQEHFDFKVHPDGKIEVTCSFLNPVNLTVLQEARFDCKIDDGAVFHW